MPNDIKLHWGDARELILGVPDASQDLVLTDPPYDMITKNIKTPPLTHAAKELMVRNFKRILKPTGNILIFVGLKDKFRWDGKFKQYNFVLRSELIMVYPGGIKSPKHFLPAHESMLHYTLHKGYYFEGGELFEDVYKTQRPRGITRNWGYDYRTAPTEKMQVTPKPLGLAQRLVEILCPERGSVIDPYMGSGTFGEACVITDRRFTGYEINKGIYDFAENRIQNVMEKIEGNKGWW